MQIIFTPAEKVNQSLIFVCCCYFSERVKYPTQLPYFQTICVISISLFQAKDEFSQKLYSQCKKTDKSTGDRHAKVYCQNCQHFLCDSCYEAHKSWGAMKDHTFITIADLSSGKVTLSDIQDQYCSDHDGEKKKFYCESCEKLVCRDCIVLKQWCCDHDTVTLKQAADKKLVLLKTSLKKCNRKKNECQAARNKTRKAVKILSTSADKITRELKTQKKGLYQINRDHL